MKSSAPAPPEEDDTFQLEWVGPAGRQVIFEEDEDQGAYRGWAYLVLLEGAEEHHRIIGAMPIYSSPSSRAAEVQEGAGFAWDADGQGGVFLLGSQSVPLRVLQAAA